MPLAYHDYVVEAFPTNRANHPLGVRVLPGRAGRNYRFSDAQCLGLARKSLSINLVSIPNQISELCTDHGPTGSAPTLPRPVAPKPLPVTSQPPSPAALPAANVASSSTASIGKPRRFGPSPSAAAAVREPSTRPVVAEAPGSRARGRGACEDSFSVSQRGFRAIGP